MEPTPNYTPLLYSKRFYPKYNKNKMCGLPLEAAKQATIDRSVSKNPWVNFMCGFASSFFGLMSLCDWTWPPRIFARRHSHCGALSVPWLVWFECRQLWVWGHEDDIEVSWNRGTPKSPILNGTFHYKPSFGGTFIYGNPRIGIVYIWLCVNIRQVYLKITNLIKWWWIIKLRLCVWRSSLDWMYLWCLFRHHWIDLFTWSEGSSCLEKNVI